MKARILILSTGHLSDNPRVLKEATTLGDAGYEVTVIGKRYRKYLDISDQEILINSPFKHFSIDMLGGKIGSIAHTRGFIRRMEQHLSRKAVRCLGWETAEALGPSAALLRAARKIPADLTIVHNEAAQWVGLQLIGEGRKVAVDFEDWNSESLPPVEQEGCPLSLLRRNEKSILHRAVYATTTSEALAEGLFARYGGQRPYVITNSFPLSRQPRPTPIEISGPPAFFWFSQTIGPNRGLEAFFSVYAQMRTLSRLTLLGQSDKAYRKHLLSLLPEILRPQVSFHDLVTPDELPKVISCHHIGLALEQTDIVNRDLTITNKILQYLEAGLSIVATPTKGHREVFTRGPKIGIILENVNDTNVTARILDTLVTDRETLKAQQLAARKLAETHYCWEHEAPKLLKLVETALSS